MLRIFMGRDDIARTRLALTPLPLHEVLISLWALQSPRLPARLSGWRQQTIRRLPGRTRQLFEIVRHNGSPEFLTRQAPYGDLDSALDLVLSTPPALIRRDLENRLNVPAPTPWLRELAAGEREAQRGLESAVRRYYQTCLAESAARLAPHARLDAAQQTMTLSTQGVEGMINSLHPSIRWRDSTVEIEGLCRNGLDLHPGGNGLLILPSSFAPQPVVGHADGAVIVAYPINAPAPAQLARPGRDADSLATLLGRTRAAVLRAARTGGSTTQLARKAGISLPAASQHTSALRAAGLLVTTREGKSVRHSTTPLAEALLASSPAQ